MSRFNLIDEKWIPVRFLNGDRDDLGIRDTLVRAKEISNIEDSSPLVVASLHRFLLAVLYRALEGPTDIDQAKKIFRDGFPSERIEGYLEKWKDRLFVFDEKYPFWQVASFRPKEWKAWTKIAAEHNADNAKVLFDHVDIRNPGQIPVAVAIRWLIAAQTFDLAVAKSEFIQPLDAPSARAIHFIVLGRNLHDTLSFGLKPQSKEIHEMDLAVWEREPAQLEVLKSGRKRPIWGYSDLYTWQSRTVLFEDNGSDSIEKLGFASGVVKNGDGLLLDPMLCYQVSAKAGLVSMKYREDKDFWREFDSLLPGGEGRIPLVLDNAVELCRTETDRWPKGILVCGQKTKSGQAKVDFWRTSLFTLPRALSEDLNIKYSIRLILQTAEDVADSLRSALQDFNRRLLLRNSTKEVKDLSKNERSQIGDMTESSPSLSAYWSTLEGDFNKVLRAYTPGADFDNIYRSWLGSVRDSLAVSWDEHSASVLAGDAYAIRALVEVEEIVENKLKELKLEIQKYAQQKEIV